MRLEHQHARQSAHPIDVCEALGRRLNLVCHRCALQSSFVCHSPTRPAPHARTVGGAHTHGSALCRVAWLRRPRLCGHADSLRDFLSGDASLCRARRAGKPCRTIRRRQRFPAGRRSVPCLPDLRPGNKHFRIYPCRGDRWFCFSSRWRSQPPRNGNQPAPGRTS